MENAGHVSQGGVHNATDMINQEQHIQQPDAAILPDEKRAIFGLKAKIEATVRVADQPRPTGPFSWRWQFHKILAVVIKFCKFVGPGALIAVAYVDPDNFQTDVSSGVSFQYHLLFMVLVSNIVAIILQALSLKLGSVTGLDLAQMNKRYLPKWINIGLWLIAEAGMICTDVGQVIGAAIAINLLIPKIPVTAGCALAVVDTLFILLLYRPDGSLRTLRFFEFFVACIVLGVVICFCIELSLLDNLNPGDIFDGFVPHRDIFVSQGLFQSLALLGGTIMPHTLYLGSGIVQARLRDFDVKNSHYHEETSPDGSTYAFYRPSIAAIKSCMKYSMWELILVLFVSSLFVNSAIIVVAADSLSIEAADADLFGIYDLFASSISKGAATIFALALLFSATSAGIVATMAGQLVAEGAINWRLNPFIRRLVTRCLAIIPGLVIAAAVGRPGLSAALNVTNVILSVVLIFTTAPLVWYTSFSKYMTVQADENEEGPITSVADGGENRRANSKSFANGWFLTILAFFLWFVIAAMNVTLWVLFGLGSVDDL